ncbi:ImmA/IrrE family metallo-endopeptidase [Pseudomonas sp. WS 5071]|uniref:ImmA/IrrE family metallo-endopeptidase n=1 Tax=Pseudomonas sp. WS 5071 TaxID=2717479 RepID=UPI0014737C98|nr:ImmA/IrrE family metallo-endopeptidase [Pseudomonas sp. WS 5071]NMY75635.1 ImmA/IrrE family metallo-endopeptidase [Pseudomonas sp. WS 5071]
MQNIILSPKTQTDIDKRVERVLRGLDNPEPPLRIEDVRELLKLDLQFYTANNPSALRETVSKIRVGALQVFKRPELLVDAVKKLSLKALYLPDRKRILIDSDLPQKKHRWSEAHEVGHSLLPWHDDLMHGDTEHTLSLTCHDHIEAEANFAAGRLLFLQDRFTQEALSVSATMSAVKVLHGSFGNTLSSTLYRFVESAGLENPIVGIISCHPHASKRPMDYDPSLPCKHTIHSPAFRQRFKKISDIHLFEAISSYCGPQRGGPLGQREVSLSDDNGDKHMFMFETFFNRHDALTLGVYLGPSNIVVPSPGFSIFGG